MPVEAEMEQLSSIAERLDKGSARMDRLEIALAENTRITSEVRAIMEAGRAGMRLLGWLGLVVKWAGIIATGLVAIYTAIQVFTHNIDVSSTRTEGVISK